MHDRNDRFLEMPVASVNRGRGFLSVLARLIDDDVVLLGELWENLEGFNHARVL